MGLRSKTLTLDYDSPLDLVLSFLASPLWMGVLAFVPPIFFATSSKRGAPPLWPDFSTIPFVLLLACLWALASWLKANYKTYYLLESQTQRITLARKIFKKEFKSHIADFKDLQCVAVMSIWSSNEQRERTLKYAMCLVTKKARIIRVSAYSFAEPDYEVARLAKKLGIAQFPIRGQLASVQACRGPQDSVSLSYGEPGPPLFLRLGFGAMFLSLALSAILTIIEFSKLYAASG